MLVVLPLLLATLAFEGPLLQLPWKCGTTESCTQDHQGGSHTGNSAYAWDFVLQEGEEIWSASAGVVTHARHDSNSGGCDQSYSTDGNYITIDHGDGTSIVYAHMQYMSSPLSVGDTVEVGDLVARVGLTGYVCGAHLHMAVQDQCGSSHCASVPAQFADVGDPSAGESYQSANCPVCPRSLDGGVTEIDDQDAGCLLRQTKAWWSSFEGFDDHHLYTLGTDAEADVTIGTWVFGVTVPGDYAGGRRRHPARRRDRREHRHARSPRGLRRGSLHVPAEPGAGRHQHDGHELGLGRRPRREQRRGAGGPRYVRRVVDRHDGLGRRRRSSPGLRRGRVGRLPV